MVPPGELGERLNVLRLRLPDAIKSVRRSLERHGQMAAVSAYRAPEGKLELLDGFKRLQAMRDLGWTTVRVHVHDVDDVRAKAAVSALNDQGRLTELEEGWLVRSLYRDNELTQPQIGRLLDRHKSWVCRRLMLVEALDEAVQVDVRLGLLAARTAVGLGRLPYGNQRAAADLVVRRGLTTQQTDQLVNTLKGAADEGERQRIIEDWACGQAGPAMPSGRRPARRAKSPGLMIVQDITQMCRVAARLEARLLERPLASFGAEEATIVTSALGTLRPVLDVLRRALVVGAHEAGGVA
jgi:ParB family transcriptional regulator, chromosome partitioning protein